MNHIPVLLNEVIAAINPIRNGLYIDATVGDGGHTLALLEHSSPNGQVLGLDQDKNQIRVARTKLERFGSRVILAHARFSELTAIAAKHRFTAVDGILLDLGISSRQLTDSRYGLDFSDDTPLDMRLAEGLPHAAADFLNRASEIEIADALFAFGDRHNSRTLARNIVQYRRKSTFRVAYDLKTALNIWHPGALAPIFQALRIWVNGEYDELEKVLPQAVSTLKPGGTLAVISFHSGEDRIVKRFMNRNRELLKVSKKIITPAYPEIKQNSRARSAKLRTAVKLETSSTT